MRGGEWKVPRNVPLSVTEYQNKMKSLLAAALLLSSVVQSFSVKEHVELETRQAATDKLVFCHFMVSSSI
jgi:hypothetical protein